MGRLDDFILTFRLPLRAQRIAENEKIYNSSLRSWKEAEKFKNHRNSRLLLNNNRFEYFDIFK